MVISSLVVEAMPKKVNSVIDELSLANGVEVHGCAGFRIVVTVETTTIDQSHDTAARFLDVDGVVGIDLIYVNFEDDPHLKHISWKLGTERAQCRREEMPA